MNNYRIQFKTSAAKEFKKLPPSVKQRVGESLDQLQQDPRPSGVVKLQGEDQLYRVRVGDYRIVYTIDDHDKIIKITRIRHRQDVYKE
ncbi:MAG: type II toxin-antitoxin system RelE/ParE family toxin [Microcystis viridis Mv_BB_P_19951000_S69]|jgi:mRNA interferase RelE/StbE|uniref:Type II toxin-antitoxin system RelE/ParE family toxin n=2 Tax=Microcystis TaxID=1125 RepID=A0A552HHR6_MICVR|nr:type II toxin-antitoxin system RelE/ParE family toxin [Microcystis aeruginosa]MCU7242719.1 type II toxin-antitoxin system RelE/ParE family toxin [Microcystis aeruginosa WS75]NCR25084.1 type II toxin-antitoxin system RelE/ParE family toxin [Microcystis aeruginosa LE13-04]NCS41936.1 type II toxin-antitoxin system RelE/ParE family toxin [Microcystis aeruginosa BS13-10]TRU69605.1 MAG: type II toxin-antitoxin system RelE/ParE family toxin [Microcystis viridis Mv_BB_P_19951000_S69]TRU70771.1 MAG: